MTDREKAIEILQSLADGKMEELHIWDDEGGDVCRQILEEQNAILAGIEALKERPHGEWVLDKEFSFVFNIYECSKCRFDGSKRWQFCPNCGASMQKEGEENGI